MNRHLRALAAILLATCLLAATTVPASAHQPFFEDKDFTAAAPGAVKDPLVSTALYATLASSRDLDYVTFDGKAGQRVLIGITVPAIAGQEHFTPTVALLGPGLPAAALPTAIDAPAGSGAVVLRAPAGTPKTFFEPFSRTSYWERQEEHVTLPADGRYTLAVWSERGDLGRYTLVVGDREVFGGDPAFGSKLAAYWTPVPPEKPAAGQGDTEQSNSDKPGSGKPGSAKPGSGKPGSGKPATSGCGQAGKP